MKTYIVYFAGHYPVGSVALVNATNKQEAKQLVELKLVEIALPQRINEEAINEYEHNTLGVTILHVIAF